MGACIQAMQRKAADAVYHKTADMIAKRIAGCDDKLATFQQEMTKIDVELALIKEAIKRNNGAVTHIQKMTIQKHIENKQALLARIEDAKATRRGFVMRQTVLAQANDNRDNVELMGHITKATRKLKFTPEDVGDTIESHVDAMSDLTEMNLEVKSTINQGDQVLHDSINDRTGSDGFSVDQEVADFLASAKLETVNELEARTYTISDEDYNDTKNKEKSRVLMTQVADDEDENPPSGKGGGDDSSATSAPKLLLKKKTVQKQAVLADLS